MSNATFSLLVVDDDEDDRLIIDEAFKAIGFAAEVKKFINGKMLLAYLDQLDASLYPSLIVLDNTLPELNTRDVVKLLKENSAYKDIPVVVYTTTLSASRRQELLDQGVYACIEKGSTLNDVVQVVQQLKMMAEKQKIK